MYLRRLKQRYIEEQKEIKRLTRHSNPHGWYTIYYSATKEKEIRGVTGRESNASYNIKEITVITRKPTLTDQRAEEEK